MTDYTKLITSQHVRAPKFMAMMKVLSDGLDSMNQVTLSMPSARDIDNASGQQLDDIGVWVGRPRVVEDILTPAFFGFSDDLAAQPFGEVINVSIGGRFYEQDESFSTSSTLGDPEYRTILKAKIVKNQWNGLLDGLEAAMQYVFGAPCSVIDSANLTLQLIIGRPITAIEKTLLSTFDILPRTAGVAITSIQYRTFISAAATATTTVTGQL